MCVGAGKAACQNLNVLACACSAFPTQRFGWQFFDLFHLYLTRALLLSAVDKKIKKIKLNEVDARKYEENWPELVNECRFS